MKLISRFFDRLGRAGSLLEWATILAGPAVTAIWVGYGVVIWLGNWSPAVEQARLDWLGWGQMVGGLMVMTVLVSIARVQVSAEGPGGTKIDLGGDDEPK